MSIFLPNSTIKVVDRTLPELVFKKDVRRLKIIYFCWLLKDIGVDWFEINSDILDIMGKLPVGLDFVYRIRNQEDVQKCILNEVEECLVSINMLSREDLLVSLNRHGINIQLEYPANTFEELEKLILLRDMIPFQYLSEIRVTGLNAFPSEHWAERLWEAAKQLDIHVSICPQNKNYSATAVCLEGMLNHFDRIVVSFMGYGRNMGYSALEEVLMAAGIIMKQHAKADLKKLPEIADLFSILSGVKVPSNKAVIGPEIFMYQSGIHADGIEKNPITYEPYDPRIVGQERKLTVGKHSGRKAVQKKMKELGIHCDLDSASDLLDSIRKKSIEYKRDLFDYELMEICRNRMIN